MRKQHTIRVATRPSKLAVTQTQQAVDLLKLANPEKDFEIITFSTKGDRDQKRSLTQFGGTGLFVKELENALLENKADLAVHSLKDVPNDQPEELKLCAFPKREIPFDILLTPSGTLLGELPPNAVIGTGSPRRHLQLALARPDLKFKEIRGNIDTRIQKMRNGEYDAIILATAGLKRLSMEFNANQIIPPEIILPAIGQGCLAIECRRDDIETIQVARSINDLTSEWAILAERSFMKTIEGGCKFPLAAFAHCEKETLYFDAIVGNLDSKKFVRKHMECPLRKGATEAVRIAQEMLKECASRDIQLHVP